MSKNRRSRSGKHRDTTGNGKHLTAGRLAGGKVADAPDRHDPERTPPMAGVAAGGGSGSISSSEQEKAGVMSSDKETSELVEIVGANKDVPQAEAAAAEARRRADQGAGTDAGGQSRPEEKGAAAAARRGDKAGKPPAARPGEGGEGNITFLLTALLLPLVVVGGIYGYAAYTHRNAAPDAAPLRSEADRRIEREIAAERAEVRELPAASAPAGAPAATGPKTEAPAAKTAAETPAAAPAAAPTQPATEPHAAAPATEAKVAVTAPAAAPAAGGETHAPAHWGYDTADGPAVWGKLDQAYAACSTGQFQSPIDIPLAKGEPGPRFDYEYGTVVGDVVNNGHTVLVKPSSSNRLLVNGNAYELEQLHFHTPSEHLIGGHSFPLEIHLVHKNAAGQRAVVAVMAEEGGLDDVLERLPVPHAGAAPLALERNPLDLTKLLPESKAYFTFTGSLTTPPCTEDVGWIVLSQPIKVPRGSISKFEQVLKANNRPVQPLNGRIIYSSN
jgi:carbonic anhydrase